MLQLACQSRHAQPAQRVLMAYLLFVPLEATAEQELQTVAYALVGPSLMPQMRPMRLHARYVLWGNIAQLPQPPMLSVWLATIAPTPLFKSYVGVASTVQLPQQLMYSVWLATTAFRLHLNSSAQLATTVLQAAQAQFLVHRASTLR